MAILDRVKDVLKRSIPEDASDITPTDSLRDELGFDSLDLVQVAMEIEEEFKADCIGVILDEDAEDWQTVGDIIAYLEAKGVKN